MPCQLILQDVHHLAPHLTVLTINVPVVYMAQYVMVRNEAGKIHYEGHLKGWALELKTFLGPEMATSEASAIWAQKSQKYVHW